MHKLIIVTTTSDDAEELETIASELIQRNLAACCQISGPIKSVYRWEGKVESSQEWTCAIKTLECKYPEVEQVILKLHHYDTPQIVAVEATLVSESYQQWVRECLP